MLSDTSDGDSIFGTTSSCSISSVGKRRDGGTKYWCSTHRADATAKYGVPAETCKYSMVPLVDPSDVLELDLSMFPGGVALWGAVPPIYDTTRLPLDKGVHVHARPSEFADKKIDRTFPAVKIIGLSGSNTDHLISELDAIYFMTSSIFGHELHVINCTRCGHPHLDRDWFSVHPHKRHLCAACGRTFSDWRVSVGNPIARTRDYFARPSAILPANKSISIQQQNFKGGIQIWGSNPAIVWTSRKAELSGVHLHAYAEIGDSRPTVDETFAAVEIDGIQLDARMVSVFMAQQSLPHLSDRVICLVCSKCGLEKFDDNLAAITPSVDHYCISCNSLLHSQGKLRKIVSNPVWRQLRALSNGAVRSPQVHDIGLIPETL